MNYELIKSEFIKLKKEELEYINNIAITSSNKTLSECEKIEIYRTLKNYEIKINEIFKILCDKTIDKVSEDKQMTKANLKDIIIEFDLGENYLSSLTFYSPETKKYILSTLGIDIETFKFKLTISDLIYNLGGYKMINQDIIQNNQKLIEKSIYIFSGYYDSSEDCYGPGLGDSDSYLYGIYENISIKYNEKKEIPKRKMKDFEKDKIIIHSKRYVQEYEVRKIFEEELLNIKNKTLNDCIIETRKRIEKLNYIRSPEYKEKKLLDKINELYKKVKGEYIGKEILYSGNFLEIIRETYKLPNEKIFQKEKIIKNNGQDSVIIIAITQENEYIITFQNRIKDKVLVEFPSGYIEKEEDPIEAAKRELKEETGYITDDLFILDEAYTSPGIDNSITYIVVANNCIKKEEPKVNNTEFVKYGLFTEIELKYLIHKNIMNGAMNKLAYYNLINNADNSYVIYTKRNQRIYKKPKKKTNPIYK